MKPLFPPKRGHDTADHESKLAHSRERRPMYPPKFTLAWCLVAVGLFLLAGTFKATSRHSLGGRLSTQIRPLRKEEIQGIPPFDDNSVRLYIGVVSGYWNFGARHILRAAYSHYTSPADSTDRVTVRFVLGKPSQNDPGLWTLLRWENETYGDIHMIDMEENMNEGKSYEYFASLSQMYPDTVPRERRPWDYAMKVDDDSFLHVPKLLEKMRSLPRTGTWFGRGNKHLYYMFGPGYILSWDIVNWLEKNRDNLQQFMKGWEDKQISEMIKWGGRAEEMWTEMDADEYIDFPGTKAIFSAEMTNKTILVHQLKDVHNLGKAINHFMGSDL